MAPSVSAARRPAEVQSLDLPLTGLTPRGPATVQPLNDDQTQWVLDAMYAALKATTKLEAAAAQMGMNHSLMTRQLTKADGHFSLRRAGALDRETWLRFADLVRAHFGVVEDPREGAQQDAEAIAKALCRLVARVR